MLKRFGRFLLWNVLRLALFVRNHRQRGVKDHAAYQTSDCFVESCVETIGFARRTLFVEITFGVTVENLVALEQNLRLSLLWFGNWITRWRLLYHLRETLVCFRQELKKV